MPRVARAAFVLLLAACAAESPAPAPALPPPTSDDLLAADRAFAAATAERGLDGWMSYYTADAVRLRMAAETAQGLDAVRAFDAPIFADTTTRLVWEPTAAGLFADSVTGYTTGRSAMIRPGAASADTLYRGRYITLWRREASGAWKVFLDTGE